jgi:hypothetical protein
MAMSLLPKSMDGVADETFKLPGRTSSLRKIIKEWLPHSFKGGQNCLPNEITLAKATMPSSTAFPVLGSGYPLAFLQ